MTKFEKVALINQFLMKNDKLEIGGRIMHYDACHHELNRYYTPSRNLGVYPFMTVDFAIRISQPHFVCDCIDSLPHPLEVKVRGLTVGTVNYHHVPMEYPGMMLLNVAVFDREHLDHLVDQLYMESIVGE